HHRHQRTRLAEVGQPGGRDGASADQEHRTSFELQKHREQRLLAHSFFPQTRKAEEPDFRPATRLSVAKRLSPFVKTLGNNYARYASGTSTQVLHRGHLALARPVITLTRRMAFFTTSPSPSGITILVRQAGQRRGSTGSAGSSAGPSATWLSTPAPM